MVNVSQHPRRVGGRVSKFFFRPSSHAPVCLSKESAFVAVSWLKARLRTVKWHRLIGFFDLLMPKNAPSSKSATPPGGNPCTIRITHTQKVIDQLVK